MLPAQAMTSRGRRIVTIVLFAVAILASVAVVMGRLTVQTDISAFMPESHDRNQALVIGELKAGLSSRSWLLAISGAPQETLVGLSNRYAQLLLTSGGFAYVYNGGNPFSAKERDFLFRYRYLLDPDSSGDHFSPVSLHAAFKQRLHDLQSPLATFNKDQIVADPTGAFGRVVTQLAGSRTQAVDKDGVWFSADGNTAFLFAAVRPDIKSMDQQRVLRDTIFQNFETLGIRTGAQLSVSAPAYFALTTEDRIKQDIRILSIVATLLVLFILLYTYRSYRVLLLAALPIAGGLLWAAAVTTLVWGSVHGISIAFGITLLGVALDYPVHLFSHAGSAETVSSAARRIWPTLRIGALTTMLAFAAMVSANFPGIQQLGVFAISGLFAAVVITRYLLPVLIPSVPARSAHAIGWGNINLRLPQKHVPVIYTVLLAVTLLLAGLGGKNIWSDDIGALTPIPDELRQRDRDLRARMNVAEPRYQIVVRGETLEKVLQRQEQLRPLLQQSVRTGILAASDMAATILPSAAAQRTRQAVLPAMQHLEDAVAYSLRGTPFRAGAFTPFVTDVATSSALPPLVQADFGGGILATRLAGMIRKDDGGFIGVVRLIGLTQPRALSELLQRYSPENVVFLDLKDSSEKIVSAYRKDMVVRITITFILIVVTLIVALRDIRRVTEVVAQVTLSVLVAAVVALIVGQGLTLFHLVSLLLVAAIGVDYALFATQTFPEEGGSSATRQSLMICAMSTVGVFAILGTSSVPVLSAIGVTVASGTLAAYLLSLFLTARVPVEV